jgi:hypothetical protein
MQRIYQNAYTILMWAGPASHNSDIAMGVLIGVEYVFGPSDQEPPSPNDIYPYLTHPVIQEKLVPAVVADTNGRATKAFFSRPYWRRVWTLQEAVCGSRSLLCCGDYGVTWSAVARTAVDSKGIAIAIGLARTEDNASVTDTLWVARVFDPIIQHARLTARHRFGEPISLLDGLTAGRSYGVSDARDHIYGILAIVDDSDDVEVDYKKPTFQLYLDVAREQIHRSRGFNILSACRMWNFAEQRERFVPLEGMVQSCLDDDQLDTPKLSKVSEALRSSPENPGRVIAFELARGYAPQHRNLENGEPDDLDAGLGSFDEMAMAWLPSWVPRWDMLDDAKGLVTTLRQKGEISLHATPGTAARYSFTGYRGSCLQVSGTRVDTVLSVTLAGDRASIWDHWTETRAESPEDDVLATEKSLHRRKAVESIAELASSWEQRRRFIITQRGFMGLGPVATESGDIICVVFGGEVPFVLRPVREGSFYLVGEACK